VTYDGKTAVDLPPQTRTTDQLEITKIAVGPMDNNAYLLRCRATGRSLLIDAANDSERLLALTGVNLDGVLTTHSHLDHWLALEPVVSASGATTYASSEEAGEISIPTDVILADGDELVLGDVTLQIVGLAGHRAHYTDHICMSLAVVHRDTDGATHAFTGDSLFPGGIGNTCEDPAAYSTLLNDVTSKIFGRLPDDTWVYPGHGWDTTLGIERPQLQDWLRPGW